MSSELDPEELNLFLLEAYEKLDAIDGNLIAFENHLKANTFVPSSSDIQALLNSIFRDIHTIKGNSGFLAFKELEALCHAGESVLDKLRTCVISPTPETISLLLRMVDTCREYLQKVEQGQDPQSPRIQVLINEMRS